MSSSAGTLIQRAAIQCKLGDPGSDPYASTDTNIVFLREMLVSLGNELIHQWTWPVLRKSYSFTTLAGQSVYTMPADFHQMVPQSGWNRSQRLPLIGPLSSQEWEYLLARSLGMYLSFVFRQGYNTIEGNPGVTMPAGIVVAFEYISSYWAQAAGQQSPNLNNPTVSTDLVMFDDELVIAGLKLKWAEEKGFDTVKLTERYEALLENVKSTVTGTRTLSLTGPKTAVDRFIDNNNLPLSGYGH